MIDPLTRPPLGPHKLEQAEVENGAPPASTVAARAAAFVEETKAFANEMDPRRMAWELTRALPWFTFNRARARMLAFVGCQVPRGTAVCGYVHLVGARDCARRLRLGPGCVIGPDVTFCLDAPITLGSRVSIGPRAVLYTATHSLGAASRRMQFNVLARPIVVDDGAWIGMGAVVLAGVRVGRGAVVAAGAVVNEDVPPNVVVAGNPARVVEDLPGR
jgi:acetyltransferase-like isoleucine patch superfamily enzyme